MARRSATTTATNALVAGSSSFAGTRLVLLLLERGAENVVCFDVDSPGSYFWEHYEILQRQQQQQQSEEDGGKVHIFSGTMGDVTSSTAIDRVFRRIAFDVVFHLGTTCTDSAIEDYCYCERSEIWETNVQGTRNVLDACKRHGVDRLVFASSVWTRFDASTSSFLSHPKSYINFAAESMATAENEVLNACQVERGNAAATNGTSTLLATAAVAPSPILYGPDDGRFLPPLLHAGKDGTLRIFGSGENCVAWCHVENYCHGLLCAGDALLRHQQSRLAPPGGVTDCSGKLFVVSDGVSVNVWTMINEAMLAMGFDDLRTKWNVPVWVLLLCVLFPRKLLEHILHWWRRWLPSALLSEEQIRAYSMDDIANRFSNTDSWSDIGYEPIVRFEQGWAATIEWYRTYWLSSCQEGS